MFYFLPLYIFLSFSKLNVMNVYLSRNYFLFQVFRLLYVQQNFWILFGTFVFCCRCCLKQAKNNCQGAAITIHRQEWYSRCQTFKHPK